MQNAMMALVGACIILLLAAMRYKRMADALMEELEAERHNRQSLSSVYGRISEQWFPLSQAYPYDPQYFRFLGSPVDGVQFEDDRIVFVEFKANRSRLSENQKRIRQLVEEGHVYWEEFNFTVD